MTRVVVVIGLVLSMSLALLEPALAEQWRLADSFSATSSAAVGCWRLGFIGESGEFTIYNSAISAGSQLKGWAMDRDPDKAGDIVSNISTSPNDKYGSFIAPGQICLHTTRAGSSPTVRWTSPVSSDVSITATFSAQGFFTFADVRVVRNGTETLRSTTIRGFAGRGADTVGRTGDSPEVSYSGTVHVGVGDTIDFFITPVARERREEWMRDATGHVALTVAIASSGGG